jgi:hypothetical protein
MTLQYYRIYVKLKGGGQATGRDLHNGSPPASGTRLDVPLITGRIVKAEISPLPNAEQARLAFRNSVVNVYAHEL